MSGLPSVTGEFRLGDDPSLRFTPNGVAVCEFRAIAQERRNVNGEWVDGANCWVKVTGWKDLAEHMAESLEKGKLAVITGQLVTDQWEDADGNKRLTVVLRAQSIGPSLTFDSAKIVKAQPRQQQGAQQQGGGGNGPSPGSDEPPF